jgi:soluble cytochrome b562
MNSDQELIDLLKQVIVTLEAEKPAQKFDDAFPARSTYDKAVNEAMTKYREAHVANSTQLRQREEQLAIEYDKATELYRRAEKEANKEYVRTVTKLRNEYYSRHAIATTPLF